MMQTLDFVRPRSFQIQHQRCGAMKGNRGTDLFVGAGQMNRFKVLGKTDRQSLCSSGVILIEDYTEWFHDFPLTSPRFAAALAATANGCTGVIDSERDSVTCATLSRPGARTIQFGAFRSVLTESLLSLPLPPTVSGRSRKVACLLQTASETSLEEPPLFPVPEQSSRDARGTLQTLPIQLLLPFIVMPNWRRNVQQNLLIRAISWAGGVAKLHRRRPFRAESLQNIHRGAIAAQGSADLRALDPVADRRQHFAGDGHAFGASRFRTCRPGHPVQDFI